MTPGERKSVKVSGRVNWVDPPKVWGGLPGAWGPGLGAGALPRSEKSPGRRLAKGWELAETAAAEVGLEEAGTGYPPYPPPRPHPPRF